MPGANASLGDERTLIEGIQIGTVDMGVITNGPVAKKMPTNIAGNFHIQYYATQVHVLKEAGPLGGRATAALYIVIPSASMAS